LRYDSEEGRAKSAEIARATCLAAYWASVDIAKEKGAFPLFDADRYLAPPSFASRLPLDLQSAVRAHGIRNSHLLSIAPTAPSRSRSRTTRATASSRRSRGATRARSACPTRA
jgi:ribonucleoside-diphosphate reductase alpha chain